MRFANYFFDFDGTIMDTKEDVWVSIAAACARMGYKLPQAFRANPANLSLNVRDIFAAVAGEADPNQCAVFESYIAFHYRHLNNFNHSRLYPRMDQLISFLNAAGRSTVIVSNKPLPPLLKLLERHDLKRCFTAIHSADRPSSGLVPKSALLRELIQGRPEDCVYIGDAYTDVLASKANQICAVGVLYGDGDKDLLKNACPDYLAATSSELYDLIMGWETDSETRFVSCN